MTNAEAVNWIINLTADIGKREHQSLWHYEQALSEIREMLEAQPTIEERKTGRWIEETGEDEIIYHGHCFCCGWNAVVCETDVFGMPYCPNCGARMEQGEQA